MSSPYQILDNRSIDQWKVTELKEELRRRKLTIRGLKEDLVKRLDEAVRLERESAQSESDNGVESESEPSVAEKVVQSPQAVVPENLKGTVDDDGEKTGNEDNHAGPVNQDNIQEGYVLVEKDSATVEETVVVHETTVEETVVVTKSVKSEVPVREQDFTDTEVKDESGNSKPELVSDHPEPQVEKESGDSRTQLETDNSKPQLENNKNSEPKFEDVMLDASAPRNQVYEVSPNLGSPVKCDSISTDSVSINEKIEIKDNIIADNVKLELDNIKPSTVDPVRGESHPRPMDVEEPHESNASVEEKDDDINDTDADLSKKFDSLDDVGDSEKLNLDRSSGDESMEEDVLESKQVDSKYRPDDLGDGGEKTDVSAVNEGGCVDIMGDDTPTDKKGLDDGNNDHPFALAEKRKLRDQALVGNNEHVKRQRRWNSESLKVPEPQSSNLSLSTTPKDTFQSPASKGFSKVDPVTPDDAPKERVVPPSPKSPTNSLRIDRFLRPFTLKAVQELLGKTGNVGGFWMDHIKTHCYVTYSSVEEAIETRSAVYNLQWPPNGGRLLLAEFVDPQEVKTRLEAPQAPAATTVPAVPPTPPGGSQPQPSPRQPRQQQLQQVIQQTAGPASLPPPPPPTLSNPPQATRERLPHPPPPPPLEEKLDPPIVTLDDLFRKTKASPRIYYLPLSEEQVAPKLAAAQGKSATKQ